MANPKTLPPENMPQGMLWALLGSFFGSTVFIVSRFLLMNNAIDPISMSTIRFLGGGTAMLTWGLFKYGKEVLPSPGDLPALFGLGLFGMAGMSTFLFFGQQTTSAINSAIIREVVPVILNIIISFFLGEALTSFHFVGLATSTLGTLLVTGALTLQGFCFASNHFRGDLLVFCSAICWIIYSFLGRRVLSRLGSFRTTTWAMLFGGLQLQLLLQFQSTAFINWSLAWPWLIYLAVCATALVFLAWYKAMERLSWPLLNIVQCLTPVFAIILAVVFLAEHLDWLKVSGAVLVVFGIIIAGRIPKKTVSPMAARGLH